VAELHQHAGVDGSDVEGRDCALIETPQGSFVSM
jgi:hypothetical protein